MKLNSLIELLRIPEQLDQTQTSTFDSCLQTNITSTEKLLGLSNQQIDTIFANDYQLALPINSNESVRWKFVKLNLLILLKSEDSQSEFINIKMTPFVTKSLQFIVSIGVLPNLRPGYGIDFHLRSHHYHRLAPEILNEPEKLNRLRFCTQSLRTLYEHYGQFRTILLSNHLNDMLSSLIQLSFNNAPFIDQLNWFLDQLHKPILIKELMLLQSNKNAPVQLKRFVGQTLNRIMVSSPDGFHSLIRVILDSATATATSATENHWKQIDLVVRLILKQNNNHLVAIKNQLFDLINTGNVNNQTNCDDIIRIFALLMKYLWKNQNIEMFDQFLEPITITLLEQQPETSSSESVISVVYFVFVYDAETIGAVPISKLQPPECYQILLEIFSRMSAKQSTFRNKISDILSTIIDHERYVINFDNLLFSNNRNNDNSTIFDLSNCLITHFFNDRNRKIIHFFDYLLSKLMQNCCKIEHKMIFLQVLAELTENPLILQHLKTEPKSLIEFFRLFLEKSVQQRFHQSDNHDANYQSLFVILVFLKTIIEQQTTNRLLDEYRVLISVLDTLKTTSRDPELQSLAEQLADWISKKSTPPQCLNVPTKSDDSANRRQTVYEKVLNDVFSAEDYVRGHGLIQLTKMLQNNDVEASANRQYLMYLFIQNLQSDESYVYLSAINGLVAVADQYSEVVVNTLTEEYLNISERVQLNDDIRVKLGEALVRISRLLGEMAIQFKKQLIHTFLCGCRDSNPVFRTSSLSNLAEVCRVLNFKLGDSLIEILACINAILMADHEIEPKRGALVVLKLLLTGLRDETLTYLKDDILPIYRTLKLIHATTKDEVMLIHADESLTLLDNITKSFLCPKFSTLNIH